MPKVVDHKARRAELAQAAWRVVRRDGVTGASVRSVAAQAGWSPSALRHYYPTQEALLAGAMEGVSARVTERVAALVLMTDARANAERILLEVLPLDDERRAETEVWLAFSARGLVDPELRARRDAFDGLLADGIRRMVLALSQTGQLRPGLDQAVEAARLHALVDGLALHAVQRPDALPPDRVRAVLATHLDGLVV